MLFMVSCTDAVSNMLGIAPDMQGEAVEFTTDVKIARPTTRAPYADVAGRDAALESYHPINDAYDLTIEMLKEGQDNPVASSKYMKANDVATDPLLALQYEQTPIYWPDNVNKYAFRATCGTEVVEEDQSNAEKFLAQDKLLGYAYSRTVGTNGDDIDKLNYHTNKEWYNNNKAYYESKSQQVTAEEARRVPLFLKHQRSWLTIKLKAGNGVQRKSLYEANKSNISAILFSYGDPEVSVTSPKMSNTNVDYSKDLNGEAGEEQTTQFDAIVEPFDYSKNLEKEICKIVVNNMKFTYYANNDANYVADHSADMSAYNLTAGKHLTITATLSTDRIVLITALLEDWEEMTFNSICDDYGQNGDPKQIPDVKTLKEFLSDPEQNKAGNTAIISAAQLTLDDDWDYSQYNLEATLNLAGATIHTKKQFLDKIGHNSTVVNGVIDVQGTGTMNAALCQENHGTVQQVTISSDGGAKATKGAICDINYGTIYGCVSELKVQGDGTADYVGGIAAESKWGERNDTSEPTMPIIDKCVVNGRVGAESSDKVLGVGGIVGFAEGRLTNNTFNYGITITYQGTESNRTKYQNIVAATSGTQGTTLTDEFVYNNSWPTTISNKVDNGGTLNMHNANSSAKYEAVIDCQSELELLIKNGVKDKNYRIAADFEVNSEWAYGKKEEDGQWDGNNNYYNHAFNLDGDNHIITTHGKMLFSHINGEFSNIRILLAESINEEPNDNSTNTVAALAYSVNGTNARLSNIKVMMADDVYIQSSQPAGLVSWAFGGAEIQNCEVLVHLNSKMKQGTNGEGNDARRYMGGIAAFSADATFTGCKVHSGSTIQEIVGEGETKHTQLFRGGIVGGVTEKNQISPSTLIQECSSWWYDEDYRSDNDGTIIGRTVYAKTASTTENGMREGCQGNWWSVATAFPCGGTIGNNYEKIIGRRNSVNPSDQTGWWNK